MADPASLEVERTQPGILGADPQRALCIENEGSNVVVARAFCPDMLECDALDLEVDGINAIEAAQRSNPDVAVRSNCNVEDFVVTERVRVVGIVRNVFELARSGVETMQAVFARSDPDCSIRGRGNRPDAVTRE